MKRTEFHTVLDRRVSRQDSDREVLADVFDPTALADRSEPKRNRFVKTFGSDFRRMLNSFRIADANAARSD